MEGRQEEWEGKYGLQDNVGVGLGANHVRIELRSPCLLLHFLHLLGYREEERNEHERKKDEKEIEDGSGLGGGERRVGEEKKRVEEH